MPSTRDETTAAHEAAHAVVGTFLGLRLRTVAVGTEFPGWVGWALFRRYPRTKRLHSAVMLAAGPAADGLRGCNTPHAWRDDFRLIDELGFSAAERRILIDTATDYLKGSCSAAWKLATAALLERNLKGEEVRGLVLRGEGIEL